MHHAPGAASFLGKVVHDGVAWRERGGYFTPQVLDALLHILFVLPGIDPGTVYYNGGFKVCMPIVYSGL